MFKSLYFVATWIAVWYSASMPTSGTEMVRICYMTNWAVYRPGAGSFAAEDVDPFLCTHIIVAFMKLENNGISYQESADEGTLETLTKMRDEQNPALKILVAIGGWNAGSYPFIPVVESDEAMDAFISQSISFLRKNNLDGLDIDWEYPQGHVEEYSTWLQKLRDAFERDATDTGGNRLILTAAVAAGKGTIDWAYDVPKLSKALDYILVMAYDFHGPWSAGVNHNAPLQTNVGCKTLSVQWAINYWINRGADPRKIAVGIPTYGHVIKLCVSEPFSYSLGTKACGTGKPSPYTQSVGFEAYYESCLKIQCVSEKWTTEWDDTAKVPFMYRGNQWISHENQRSIIEKVKFVKSKHLAGVMVWTLDMDDFRGICGHGIKSPLMKTLLAVATDQPIPQLSKVPSPTLDPCDPLGKGLSQAGNEEKVKIGTAVNLEICDKKCTTSGFHCVPDNKWAFYLCQVGFRHDLQYCQPMLWWNDKTKNCDWPENYPGCECMK